MAILQRLPRRTRRVLRDVLTKITMIPDDFRTFELDLVNTRQTYRITEPILRKAIRWGLPTKSGLTVGKRFERCDVANLALHLGVRSPESMAMRLWTSTLQRVRHSNKTRYRIRYLPRSGSRLPDEVSLPLPDSSFVADTNHKPGANLEVDVEVASHDASWGSATRAILGDAGRRDFFFVPSGLTWDASILRSKGIGACANAVAFLEEELAGVGIRTRRRFGLILAVPYSSPHWWIEVEHEDRYLPVDPLLIGALAKHASLDTALWPGDSCVSGFVLPFSVDGSASSACGVQADAISFATSLIS